MGNWVDCLMVEHNNYIIVGWKPYMLTRLPSLTHSVLFVLQEVAQGRKMDGSSCCFVYKSVYVYICWMTFNVIVYALWSVSEHDIPTFDYEMKSYFYMKCFDKYLFYHVLFWEQIPHIFIGEITLIWF